MSDRTEPPPASPVRPADVGIGHLFNYVRDAVIVADVQSGRILLWNPAAAAMLGHSAEEAIGQLIEIIVPERLHEAHRKGLERYRSTGRGRFVDRGGILSLRAKRKDGIEIDVEMTLSPLGPEDGAPLVVAMLRDVTDRNEAAREQVELAERLRAEEQELRRANRELRRANDALEAFSYVVSHDLKEPVRALDMLLRSLKDERLQGDAADLVRHAVRANERLTLLLQGLLEYSRLSVAELRLDPLRVEDLVRSPACAAHYDHLVAERGASFVVEDRIPPVLGDAAALCQVLGNLITNALRHHPGDAPRVRLSGSRVGGGVEVLIEDDGPGFPDVVLRRFQDGTLTPRAGGGFGLALAKRAAERMGGHIALENRPEGGARVRLTLQAA